LYLTRRTFHPVINYSIPTHISISFTLSAILKVIWSHPFISWDPEECGDINKLTVTAENLWLRDIFIVESNDVDHTLDGLSACVTNEGHVVYNKPMQVTSICSLDIYFSFDQKNCTLTFSSFLYTGVYFALCLSLMAVRLLETIFITYLLHLATTQPPPRPRCLRSLLLHCTSPRKRCPAALWKEDVGLGLTPTHLSGQEPGELGGKELGPREAELNGASGWTRARLADLWVHFSHMMDTLLFRIYLLFLATSITTVIILWNT
ncbi:hypothetical protein EI555_003457, partial [Monodon monoceros]